MDVIKEKLYLHDIADTTPTSVEKSMDTSNYHAHSKAEYCNMKHEYPSLPHYFNRLYPYCYTPHMYDGTYQSTPSKYRSPFHTYCNPLKKHCVTSHQCYKDFPEEECLWPKHNYIPSEDMWSCYPTHIHSNTAKKKEHLEAVPKTRKKLQIIDPVTGVNVLEAEVSTHPEQSDVFHVKENSESSENYESNITGEKYAGDYFCNAEINNETSIQVPNEECGDSDTMHHADLLDKTFDDNSNLEKICNDKSTLIAESDKEENFLNEKDGTALPTVESSGMEQNIREMTKNAEKVHHYDSSKLSKQLHKICHNRETSTHMDFHGTCQAHHKKECSLHACKESVSKQSDLMQESLRQLRDKLYSLRQEQQRMAILQSFLRYKKYQLEESARNLDEKRIEIANWECNLYNKAKRLHDKEQWLENKSDMLTTKAQQLAEQENILNKEESKISGDTHFSKNVVKDTHFSEKKFSFNECANAAWEEIPKMKNYRSDESNEYSYLGYTSTPNKVSEGASSSIEKCKSDACSLDELERSIVFIEKMHSSSEVADGNVDNKPELASVSAVQNKEENVSYDPIGYSKGRRYLPEHIKYWLNKRDKSAL